MTSHVETNRPEDGCVTVIWGQDGARSIRSNGSSVRTIPLAERPDANPWREKKNTSVFRFKEITSVFGLYKRRNGRTSTEQKNKTKNGLYRPKQITSVRLRGRTAPMAHEEMTMVLFGSQV